MIYFCGLLSDVGDAILHGFRMIFARMAALIYDGIVWAYDLFTYISRAEILDNDFVNEIYRKVGLILGLFMMFKLIFTLIQSLIDPTKFSDKKNGFGQIIMRSIVAIVLLGITPTIFKEAFKIQNLIVGNNNSDNVIYKLIIGKRPNNNATSFGKVLASEVFFSFYTDNEEPHLDFLPFDVESADADITIDNITSIKESIETGRSFQYAIDFVGGRRNKKYVIEFDEIFCIGTGVVVFWMTLMYCIQTSIRVFQLAYLQLIAPIPILSYISDSEGTFKKWIKQCTSTFLDLFIRLAIIYFCVSLISEIVNQLDPSNVNSILIASLNLPEGSEGMLGIIKVFLIIGLLLFAKKVPELLKDLFPNIGGGAASLSMGLKAPKEVSSFTKGAATFGAGLVAGGVAGVATGIRHGENFRGKLAGGFGGLFRGAASARTKGNIFGNAQKGISNVRAANQRAYERHHDGSSYWGRKMPVHASRVVDDFERELQMYKDYDSAVSIVEKELDKNSNVMTAKMKLDSILQTGEITETKRIHATDKSGKLMFDSAGNPIYKVSTVTRTATAKDIQKAKDNLKAAKQSILDIELHRGTNAALMSAVKSADTIREKGFKGGYSGFSEESLLDTAISSKDRASNFFDYKKNAEKETREITSQGGSRHEEYERAKANAKYNKKQ